MSFEIDRTDVEFYEETGYLVVRDLVPVDEVVWLREIYDRLFAVRAGREVGDQFDLGGTDEEGEEARLPQILDPGKYAPEIRAGQYRKNAEVLVRALLGSDAELGGEHAILKPAHSGAETPWHQDEAYWDPKFEYNSLSIWIPLQDATVENGCMQFVPGSHREEVHPHHSIGNDPRIHGLQTDNVDFRRAVSCPIPAGGCTVHHNRTLHYSGPNLSDEPRRALILIGGLPAVPTTSERRFPWNESKRTAREERARGAAK